MCPCRGATGHRTLGTPKDRSGQLSGRRSPFGAGVRTARGFAEPGIERRGDGERSEGSEGAPSGLAQALARALVGASTEVAARALSGVAGKRGGVAARGK